MNESESLFEFEPAGGPAMTVAPDARYRSKAGTLTQPIRYRRDSRMGRNQQSAGADLSLQ